MERLQKILANAGVASRRKCEELILSGKVMVNDEVVTTLGTKADPNVDVITVNGKTIGAEKKVYIVFNKPKGVITSASDPQGRKIVTDYLKGIKERLYPVGRLDYDTEGLLILTNDGDFAHLLTHPKHHVSKTYLATVKGVPHGTELDKLKQGIMLEDGMTAPAEAEYHDIDPEGKQSTISITIHEGRNRQVRRMFDAISHPVLKLKRISFGDLFLGNLKRGIYRHLTKEEVEGLYKLAEAAGKTNKSFKKESSDKPNPVKSNKNKGNFKPRKKE
ncbi:pseudouridine synthase [Paenibacillus lutimineralis]|uniref:Pseudouridine synthase n=1 Tax=Paenibacillus lutimineralis TaxID=2707005 RepID=A0A3Q9IAI6_9BACL|nr:pseudouridine synthase [Paenibacillus lutimineralis]AZS14787.1 rRNA pseudouridine synthase [Paenibacillus lutimineralis]